MEGQVSLSLGCSVALLTAPPTEHANGAKAVCLHMHCYWAAINTEGNGHMCLYYYCTMALVHLRNDQELCACTHFAAQNSLGLDIRCTFAAAVHFFQFSLLKDYWLSLLRAISYLIAQLIWRPACTTLPQCTLTMFANHLGLLICSKITFTSQMAEKERTSANIAQFAQCTLLMKFCFGTKFPVLRQLRKNKSILNFTMLLTLLKDDTGWIRG